MAENRLMGEWHYPTEVHFGAGSVALLQACCKKLKMDRPLLVCDEGLISQPFIQKILDRNVSSGLGDALFSGVKSNPRGEHVLEGVEVYREASCDGVIAVGGGSALDAGKAIALMVGQERSLWDFEDVGDHWRRVNEAGMAPVIAIPTTAGTGSEVGRAAVILDSVCKTKKIIFHPNMMPEVVLVDPELTLALPANLTAATGLDAFVHLLEAYCAPGYHPMAEGIALEGMRLVKNNLVDAFEDGGNLRARSHMMSAALMGAVAFQKGLGGVHALAHPLGARFDRHHGLLNAILLPYVLRKNSVVLEEKIKRAASFLEIEIASFEGFFQWLLFFRQKLKIPDTLLEIGLDATEREWVGEMAFRDPAASGNPLVFSASDYADLFENAVMGKGL